MGILTGRTVIVTGAGQGLGRAHARELASHGAVVVVNDTGESAHVVAAEIIAAGGTALAVTGDVADWQSTERLISKTVATFGGLHALVNNAGINRDRMLVNMSEEEWDAVIRVNLKGHFIPLRHAAAYWRDMAKAGTPVQARVVNTSSGAGLMGSVGQGNYAAAKAGVAALTIQAATELARYGVIVNGIAPAARTQMTLAAFPDQMKVPESGFDAMDPANVSPLVAWLCSEDCSDVTGRMFEVAGGHISVADGWQHGPEVDAGARWKADEVGSAVRSLIASAPAPAPVYGAS